MIGISRFHKMMLERQLEHLISDIKSQYNGKGKHRLRHYSRKDKLIVQIAGKDHICFNCKKTIPKFNICYSIQLLAPHGKYLYTVLRGKYPYFKIYMCCLNCVRATLLKFAECPPHKLPEVLNYMPKRYKTIINKLEQKENKTNGKQ